MGVASRAKLSLVPAPSPRAATPTQLRYDVELCTCVLTEAAIPDSRSTRRRLYRSWQGFDRNSPGDRALGERLTGQLTAAERNVLMWRVAYGASVTDTARALAISETALLVHEAAICRRACSFTARYHAALICEPAVWSDTVGSKQQTEAVVNHLRECRRCGPEFAARILIVLHHAAVAANE
jgi:DNA-binding CsgD family transcriptional regulator